MSVHLEQTLVARLLQTEHRVIPPLSTTYTTHVFNTNCIYRLLSSTTQLMQIQTQYPSVNHTIAVVIKNTGTPVKTPAI